MKDLKRILYPSVVAILVGVSFVSAAAGQDRQRLVKTISSQPINQPAAPKTTDKTKTLSSSTPANRPVNRPTLTTAIKVVQPEVKQPLVNKTALSRSSAAAGMSSLAAGRMAYAPSHSFGIMREIQERMGIPYLYGSSGPNRYDCSGFVWAVFRDAGMSFERSSARSLWAASVPVSGDDRYKFGTLVFMNGLGHMGIVADENGFYHASSSKGITYSTFKGYWEKRIVGFRRLPADAPAAPLTPPVTELAK